MLDIDMWHSKGNAKIHYVNVAMENWPIELIAYEI
jgi:hypothetical protein